MWLLYASAWRPEFGTEDGPEGGEAATTTDVERVADRFRGGGGGGGSAEAATAATPAGHAGDGLRQVGDAVAAAAAKGEEEGGGAEQQIEQGRVAAGDETRKDARSGEGKGEGSRSWDSEPLRSRSRRL